jgi:hypothetical protein
MKKFLIKIGVYGFLSFLLLNLIAYVALFFLGKSQLYKPQFLKNGIAEQHFDYIVLGSSTGLTTLNTKTIDSVMNWNGLNLSMDDSSLNSHVLMLEYFLSMGKKTEKVILCVTPWDLQNANNKLNDNDYRFLTEISNPVIYEHYSTFDNEGLSVLKYSKYVPILGMSYYNNELFYPALFTVIQPKKRNRFDEKGNFTYPNSRRGVEERKLSYERVTIKNPAFNSMRKLCQKNNIELLVYQSPLFRQSVEFLNFKGKIINHSAILPDYLFYDPIHVTTVGRSFCTLAFCKDLKQ